MAVPSQNTPLEEVKMNATVILVTYRSTDVLQACLKSIPKGVEVIIVNQESTDEVEILARRERPYIRVIASGRNRGFGAGCNLGAANATGDVLIFLNPDTRLHDGCVDRLVETTLSNDGTLTGPRIVDDAGHDITCARNWSSSWTDAISLLVPLRILPGRWRRDIPPDHEVYRKGGSVAYVQGACMAIGRDRFEKIGGFDEELFLFGEEELLAQKLARESLLAILEPRASIMHVGHTSLAKTGGFAVEQYHRSRALWYRRDADSRDIGLWRGAARCLPLATGLVFLLLTSPVRPRLHYRPIEDAAWCRAALRGLYHGLLRHPVTGPDPAQ
jgi:N-acetylglucosaminyl-diphospho-decaprenol L-rhamnosyltransferase